MKGRILATMCVVVLAWTGLTGWGASTTKPGPSTRPAERLGAFIRAIREAGDPRAAMSAYARGCAIDRSGAEIHDAYMRRMLKFGLPKIAYYPARVLVRLDPDNGLAWGVVGYTHGKRGELAEAFSATVRSLEKNRDDPSVLHNAGQLVGWYDSELDLPKISDRVRRSLAQMKDELAGKKPYTEAYRAIKTAYAQRASLIDQFDKKIAAAEGEVLAVRQTAMEIDSQLRELADQIDHHNRVIDNLWRELRYEHGRYYRDEDGRRVYYRRYNRQYRDDLYDRIHEEERAVERLKAERRRIRSRGKAVLVELKGEEAALNGLRRKLRQAKTRTERKFRWDPPAVDGVVTPEAEYFPVATRPATPADPEAKAAQRLDLARLYLRHEMNEKAVVILQGILEDYGSTKAAKQAKIMLATLKPLE